MKSKKQIWMVYTCDDWKGKPMQCIMCTTSVRKLKSFIIAKIKDNTFGYCDDELSKTKQIAKFKADWTLQTRDHITWNLKNGYYDYCYDGEEM